MSAHSDSSSLKPGQLLYKYELRQRIGHGSFGEVWLAADQAVHDEYAIKILKPGTPIHERLKEAKIGHQLDHSNVVRVHQADVVREGQNQYVILAMDYIEKGSVSRLANPSRYLDLPTTIRIGCDILRGLEYLHGFDLIHNDIKPENVLVGPRNQGMLTDYGIAGITQDGAAIPAPKFYKIHVAPEVLETNLINAQSDIYQVGLTMFRMLVGLDALRSKFDEQGEHDYYQSVSSSGLLKSSDFPPYVPHRLRQIVQKASNQIPNDRYQSAQEMRWELERLNYKGFWTVKDNGNFVGKGERYDFRYEKTVGENGRYNVEAYKQNRSSRRETRARNYCHQNISNSQAKKEISKFVRAVVDGKI